MKWFGYETNDPMSFAFATDLLRRLGYNTEILENIPNDIIGKGVTIWVTNEDPESISIHYSTGQLNACTHLDDFTVIMQSNALNTEVSLKRAIYKLNNSFSASELKALLKRVPELQGIIDETKIL